MNGSLPIPAGSRDRRSGDRRRCHRAPCRALRVTVDACPETESKSPRLQGPVHTHGGFGANPQGKRSRRLVVSRARPTTPVGLAMRLAGLPWRCGLAQPQVSGLRRGRWALPSITGGGAVRSDRPEDGRADAPFVSQFTRDRLQDCHHHLHNESRPCRS
jgi:hypothetical protein